MRELFLVALLVVATAAPASGGRLGLADLSFGHWEPTDCRKPSPPWNLGVRDKVADFNRYVDSANSYISCVVREANDDIRSVNRTIKRGAEDAQRRMINEVETARSYVRR